jgi:hypothetical protein
MLELALALRDRVGCVGLVVDAKPDAVDFSTTLGFKPMPLVSGSLGDRPEPIAMFLPIREIAAAAEPAGKELRKARRTPFPDHV